MLYQKNEYYPLLKNILQFCSRYSSSFKEDKIYHFYSLIPEEESVVNIGLLKSKDDFVYPIWGSYFEKPNMNPSLDSLTTHLQNLNISPEVLSKFFCSNVVRNLNIDYPKNMLSKLEAKLLEF